MRYSRCVPRVRSSMKVFLTIFSFAVLLLAVCAARAQEGRLLVDQKGDRSLAIVDPVAGKVIADVAEGGTTGHEVAGSPDGRLAFVPIYGNSGVGLPGPTGRTSWSSMWRRTRSWGIFRLITACGRIAQSSGPRMDYST